MQARQSGAGTHVLATVVKVEGSAYRLGRVLTGPAAYIGQLGPRNRTERLLAQIQETTPKLPGLDRLHYPMGLDIGGDGPEAVALAVLAEMTAVLNARSGQMLKWRERPIHDSELRIPVSS
nr:XdhC family protein [Pseudomonas sp. dw_612]